MKRKPTRPDPGHHKKVPDASAPLRLTRARQWLYRITALALLPLLLLVAAELVLRIAGYGYSPDFFARETIGGDEYLVENEHFGWRFFPPELARSPAPVVMTARKPADTYRIFIFGESAALGDPRPAYGAGRYLQVLLRERFPKTKFEVVCVAMTAINSHAILPIARECAREDGNIWIIYMGNNEMVGPFGAATVFGPRAPPLILVRLELALQRTRLGQLLMAWARKLHGSGAHGSSWGGMQMFTQSQIAPHDPHKETVYHSFRENLDDILAAGRAAGAGIILNTVAVNLRDCAPFASMSDPALTATDQARWQRLYAEGVEAQKQSQFAQAAQAFAQAAAIDPNYAELQFRWGTCLLQLTNYSAAYAPLALARDCDALPFRADSRINAAIEQAPGRVDNPNLVLCDAARVLATNTPTGIAGQESFYEHVHLNFGGNYHLALAWAQEVERFLPETVVAGGKPGWAAQELCEQRLGLTTWNTYGIVQDLLDRFLQPPFTRQAGQAERLEAVRAELRKLRSQMTLAAAANARATYISALKRSPKDYRLHENYAEFLEAVGDLPQAVQEWQQVAQLLPHHHLAYFEAGRLLVRQGELAQAKAQLFEAVARRPDLAEGWLELGKIAALEGQPELALKYYERERLLAPEDPRVYYHIGKAYSKLNRRAEAIRNLRKASELQPDFWEAHYALGEELGVDGQLAEAGKQLEETIRLQPGYAVAHLNLGIALAKQGQWEEALRRLEESVRLDPSNSLARSALEQVRTRLKR